MTIVAAGCPFSTRTNPFPAGRAAIVPEAKTASANATATGVMGMSRRRLKNFMSDDEGRPGRASVESFGLKTSFLHEPAV
jgi:hypothetical protein